MAVTATTLRARFKEFDNAVTKGDMDDTLLGLFIVAAQTELSESAFGDLYDEAVMYQAAHLIAMSPYGLPMRLVSQQGSTIYAQRVMHLARSRPGRISVGSTGS